MIRPHGAESEKYQNWASGLSGQLIEQRLGFFQIHQIKQR